MADLAPAAIGRLIEARQAGRSPINSINPRTIGLAGYLQLCAATFVVIPAITLGYAALAAQLSRFVASRKARRRINKGAGAVMAGAGALIMVK